MWNTPAKKKEHKTAAQWSDNTTRYFSVRLQPLREQCAGMVYLCGLLVWSTAHAPRLSLLVISHGRFGRRVLATANAEIPAVVHLQPHRRLTSSGHDEHQAADDSGMSLPHQLSFGSACRPQEQRDFGRENFCSRHQIVAARRPGTLSFFP